MQYEPRCIRTPQCTPGLLSEFSLLDIIMYIIKYIISFPYLNTDAPGEIKQVITTRNGDEVVI